MQDYRHIRYIPESVDLKWLGRGVDSWAGSLHFHQVGMSSAS